MEGKQVKVDIDRFSESIRRAEMKMLNELNRSLFACSTIGALPSEEELRELRRWKIKQAMLTPWFFIKGRVLGIWSVLVHGEYRGDEHYDDEG